MRLVTAYSLFESLPIGILYQNFVGFCCEDILPCCFAVESIFFMQRKFSKCGTFVNFGRIQGDYAFFVVIFFENCEFFRGCQTFWKMVSIFTQTCPNHTGVGAIDNPDRFEDVFDPHCVQEVLEKLFIHQIPKVCPHRLAKNGLFLSF